MRGKLAQPTSPQAETAPDTGWLVVMGPTAVPYPDPRGKKVSGVNSLWHYFWEAFLHTLPVGLPHMLHVPGRLVWRGTFMRRDPLWRG